MKAESRGLLISIDGMGGAGKSTTVELLARYLSTRSYTVHTTTQPSLGALGELALHGADTYRGRALACLVAADRYHHLEQEIRPQLAAGRIVLCDRYVPSSLVFQRMDGVEVEFIEELNADAERPDLAVILTADPETTAARIAARGAHSRFENGLDTSRREAELYGEVTKRLGTAGYQLLSVDTTDKSPQRVAEHLGEHVTRLADGAWEESTTA